MSRNDVGVGIRRNEIVVENSNRKTQSSVSIRNRIAGIFLDQPYRFVTVIKEVYIIGP